MAAWLWSLFAKISGRWSTWLPVTMTTERRRWRHPAGNTCTEREMKLLYNNCLLSVTLSWFENRARHTDSSDRYHKWFSRALLVAKLISLSVDSYFLRLIQRARLCPRASKASGIFGCMKKGAKIARINESEILPSVLDCLVKVRWDVMLQYSPSHVSFLP